MQTKTQLANELWPYIAPRVQQAVAASSRASGGTANVPIGEHNIGGGLHNGLLRDAQAPQFLLLDGSRDLAGNLATADGVTIDGVDLSAHVLDGDAHHAQTHNIVGGDHLLTGAKWSLVGATATNTPGLLAPLADVTGVTKEAILKSDSSGYLTLVRAVASDRLRAPMIDTATGHLTLGPAVDLLLSPGSNLVKLLDGKAIQTESFVSGFAGNGFRIDQGISRTGKTHVEVDDLTVRGRMSVYELLIRQIRATNGSIFVSSAAKVKRINTISGGWQLHTTTVGETPTATSDAAHGFLVGDLVRAQRTRWNGAALEGIYQCDLRVTGVPSLYTFDAVHIAGDLPVAGMDFVRIGSATDPDRRGSVYLTADDTNAPFIDVVDGIASHADWNTAGKVKVRLGKLTGISGQVDAYGIFSGNPAATWQSMETVNGFRIGVAGAVRFGVDTSGNLRLYNSAGTNVIALDSDGSSYFAGVMTIGVNGEIQQGTGVLGSTYTGLRIWRDGDVGRIGGYKNNVVQWSANTLGELRAGGDLTALAADGLGFGRYAATPGTPVSTAENRGAVAWWDSINARTGSPMARIYAVRSNSGNYPALSIEVDPGNANAALRPAMWLVGPDAGYDRGSLRLLNVFTVLGLPGLALSKDSGTNVETVTTSGVVNLGGTVTMKAHLLRDAANAAIDIGAAANKFRAIYVGQVVADSISGATMAGQTWTYPGGMTVDAVAAGDTVVSIANSGAGRADLSVDRDIVLGGLVDGVDLSVFYAAYGLHIANTNIHHNQSHGLDSSDHTGTLAWAKVDKAGSNLADLVTRAHSSLTGIGANDHHNQAHVLATAAGLGADHTVTGLTAGHVLRASGAAAAAFAQLGHGDLGGVTADQHHAQVHGILSSDHTVIGSALQVIGLTATNTLGLLTPSAAPGQTAALLRTNSGGGLTLYLLGLTSGNIYSAARVAMLTGDGSAYQNLYYSTSVNVSGVYYSTLGNHSFHDSATGAYVQIRGNSLLASNDSGHVDRVPANGVYSLGAIRGDTKVSTPILDTVTGSLAISPAVDLTLSPVGGDIYIPGATTLRSTAWTAGLLGTGWGIQERQGQAGKSHLDIRSIYTDELIATTFVADQVRVRSGSDWLGESQAIAARDNSDAKVTIPAVGGAAVRVYVENAPEVTGRIFDENEHVLIKTINRSSGLVIRETWGRVSSYIAEVDGRQSYSWTTTSGGGGFTLEPGTALTGFGVAGGSYIFRTVVEAGRGPFERFATWSGNPYTPANRISRVEVGDIRNALGDATPRYGIAGGNNLALTPTTGFSGFSADSVYGFQLYNSTLRSYSGGTQTVQWDANGNLWVGPSSADKRFIWDGSQVTVVGQFFVTGGNAATLDNIAGAVNLVKNSSFELDSNSDGLADGFSIYNNDGVSVPTTASIVGGVNSRRSQRISWSGASVTTKGIIFNSGVREAGQPYVISFWARASFIGTLTLAFNSGVNFPSSVEALTPVATDGTWRRYAWRVTWAGASSDNWYVWGGAGVTNGLIDFDNVMVYAGTIMVPYSASPTDIMGYGGLLNMPVQVGGAGLYGASTHLGYWDGSAWKAYFDNQGNFFFGGATGARLQWNGTTLAGYNASNVVQWAASSVTGMLTAGAGNVRLLATGLELLATQSGDGYQWFSPNRVTFIDPIDSVVIGWMGAASLDSFSKYIDVSSYGPYHQNLLLTAKTTGATRNATILLTAANTGSGQSSAISVTKNAIALSATTLTLTGSLALTGAASFTGSVSATAFGLSTGNIYSAQRVAMLTSDGSAYQNLYYSTSVNVSGVYYSTLGNHSFHDSATGAYVQIRGNSLLASNDSGHVDRVPVNGVYSLGGVAIGTPGVITAGYALDVNGAVRVRGSLAVNNHINLSPIAEPATSAVTGILWMGVDNKLYFKKPNGAAILVAG